MKYLFPTGENNPNWKGGRTVDPRGYVLIRVGKEHPLADCRGYAYEHRLVASKRDGRILKTKEQVHHDNENKGDNHPKNLIVAKSISHHRFFHRKPGSKSRLPGERNPMISCKCGCGSKFRKFDKCGRPRRFVSGHNTAARNRK